MCVVSPSSAPSEHAAPTTTSGAAVDTNQREDTGAEPKAPANVESSADTTSGAAPEEGYPEQTHAGKLGYGPQYPTGSGISDILKAKEEVIKGKLKHDPALVQQGHDRRNGTLAERRREYDAQHADDEDPFAQPDDGKKPTKAEGEEEAKAARESGHAVSDDAATAGTKAE
ncbi:uncharacterized protein JCM10292_003806 [Rhodotorula paludigena]|uniref:uncharacterized protein n=1 Tax=Rhodotorula paludigena TaxID=86838 RepID=UPI0031800F13